jgi:hypothetical protein
MRDKSILSYVRAEPFRPFCIVINSGKSYDVRHPETIAVGRDVFIYYHRQQPDQPFDHWESVSLLLVQNVEHVGPANGAQKRRKT